MPLTLLRTLPVSAASGLVRLAGVTYVVADDEQSLLALPDVGPATSIRLLPGELPDEHRARKASKPDFEALCRWPAAGDALLALGSGSTAARHRGCLIGLHVPGDMSKATVEVLDLAPLHAHLAGLVPAINLEGAAVVGDALALLQRGNGRANRSALALLDAEAVARALADHAPWTPELLREVRPIDLGERRGAPLAFTDASPLPDGSLVFLAAAEDSLDTYQDGALTGVALGRLGPNSRVQWLTDIPVPIKFEGVHAELTGDALKIWLVADPDDRSIAAPLYAGSLDPTTGAWR